MTLLVINGTLAGAVLLVAMLLARGVPPRWAHNIAVLLIVATVLLAFRGPRAVEFSAPALTVSGAVTPPEWVSMVWLGIAALLLLRESCGLWSLTRRRGAWREVVYEGVRLSTAAYGAPMTVGFLRATVFVPERVFGEMPAKAVAAIVHHELDHRRWRDPLVHLAVRTLRIVFWPILPLWGMELLMRRAAEQAADRAALRAGADPVSYAEILIDVARWVSAVGPGASAIAAGSLRMRIERILEPRRMRVGGAVVLLGGMAVAACLPRAVPERLAQPGWHRTETTIRVAERVTPVVRTAAAPPARDHIVARNVIRIRH